MDRTLSARRREAAWGDLGEQVQLVQARLRAGELSRREVELASYLGQPAARALFGVAPPSRWTPDPVGAWVVGLRSWGAELLAQATVAASWVVLPLWETPEGEVPDAWPLGYCCEWCDGPLPRFTYPGDDDRPRLTLLAAEACLSDPTPGQVDVTLEAARVVREELPRPWSGCDSPWSGLQATAACAAAAEAAASRGSSREYAAGESLRAAVGALCSGWGYTEASALAFFGEALAACLVPQV